MVHLFSNLVDDLRQVEFLALCSSLTSLTLEGNPVQTTIFKEKNI